MYRNRTFSSSLTATPNRYPPLPNGYAVSSTDAVVTSHGSDMRTRTRQPRPSDVTYPQNMAYTPSCENVKLPNVTSAMTAEFRLTVYSRSLAAKSHAFVTLRTYSKLSVRFL